MDAVIWIAGTLISLYTLLEVTGLLVRAERPRRRRAAAFRAAGSPLTIDLEPIPGRQANFYG